MRKTVLLLSTLALSTLPLAACGGEGEEAPTAETAPTAAPEDAPDETEEPREASDAGGEEMEEEAEATAAGPAPEDAVIPAAAVTDPPPEVGAFSLMDGSGPAHMYSHDEESILISVDSTVLASDYDTLAG